MDCKVFLSPCIYLKDWQSLPTSIGGMEGALSVLEKNTVVLAVENRPF